MSTNFDDWETDPDYVMDMDEMDQRWGSKRTVGSINMNDLIDQVQREHQLMREKFLHPSQRLNDSLPGNISRDNPAHGYQETLSKHTSSREMSRKVYTSTQGGRLGDRVSSPSDITSNTSRTVIEETTSSKPTIASKPDFLPSYNTSKHTSPSRTTIVRENTTFRPKEYDMPRFSSPSPNRSPNQGSTTTSSKHIFKEEKSSSTTSSKDNLHSAPQALKTIQEKIDAFKKEFDDLESHHGRATRFRGDNQPQLDIKGLSKRFESLCRESDDEFKRRTDARRKEFFDQIKNQVRETRKNLDGFDTIDEDRDLGVRPKVYSRSETSKEEVVSRVVKEGDKIVQNETKRNVERSSSCHGSSDDDTEEPTSIKYLNKVTSRSPTNQMRPMSPIDEIKRKNPMVEPQIKGAGLMARTLYDYQANEDDELTFDVDDLITNIDKVDKDWYKGTITKANRKVEGLFPANYVRLLNDSSDY